MNDTHRPADLTAEAVVREGEGRADGLSQRGKLLTADQIAERIGMTTDYVYRLVRSNQIPHLRFGRTIRFRAETIEQWLLACEHGTLGRST